jgi:hypothetical protein
MQNRNNLTAFDLIGYEGKQSIRIKGSRHGRKTWSTVAVKDGYTDGPVMLQRLDVVTDGAGSKLKQVTRHVDPDTPVELLTKPVGDVVRLGGDSWITEDRKSGSKQWHASGATVQIVKVHRPTKSVTVWVSEPSLAFTGPEDVKVGVVGTLDSMVGGFILDGNFSTEDGWDGLPQLLSRENV